MAGRTTTQPILIDDEVLAHLERYVPLAPLHQPNNLAPIRALRERFPELPQVACFDTAFHRGHSRGGRSLRHSRTASTPKACAATAFTACPTSTSPTGCARSRPTVAKGRVIVAHLGSGASMCALANGRSVESTMGFTALDGLPMGTRPGQIDPGVVLYLMTEKGMSAAAVQEFLYTECGLKGLSGISNDVRELLESAEPGAALALDHFVYRIGLYAGMLAALSAASTPSSSPPASANGRSTFARASPSSSAGSGRSSIRQPTKPRAAVISKPQSRLPASMSCRPTRN